MLSITMVVVTMAMAITMLHTTLDMIMLMVTR